MIRETEDYIDEHLGDRDVPWPRRYEPGEHGRTKAEILGRAKSSTAAGETPVRPTDSAARVAEPRVND